MGINYDDKELALIPELVALLGEEVFIENEAELIYADIPVFEDEFEGVKL